VQDIQEGCEDGSGIQADYAGAADASQKAAFGGAVGPSDRKGGGARKVDRPHPTTGQDKQGLDDSFILLDSSSRMLKTTSGLSLPTLSREQLNKVADVSSDEQMEQHVERVRS